jgi:hypothetical protein
VRALLEIVESGAKSIEVVVLKKDTPYAVLSEAQVQAVVDQIAAEAAEGEAAAGGAAAGAGGGRVA